MPTVGKDLFGKFSLQKLFALCPPARAFRCTEERAGKHQRLDIFHEVICQKVRLQSGLKGKRLDSQARKQGLESLSFPHSLSSLRVSH